MTVKYPLQKDLLSGIAEKTLDNGLKVICLKKTGAPVVAAQVWYKTGSANERPGIYGISHILEHMMFRGSEHVESEKHARCINDVGGHCNAFTAEDVTAYFNSVPRDHLDMVLELEADRMKGLTLDKEIFETERSVIVEEYHTYMNNPVAKAFLEFRTVFYDNHPYQVSPLGKIEDISSVTTDDLAAYRRKWYAPDNAVLVIVGEFDTTASLFERIHEHFGAIKPANNHTGEGTVTPFHETERRGVWMKRRVNFDVPILLMGYPSPASADADVLPLDIFQMILAQGETSRLHREIVRKQSIAVMAGGMNHSLKRAGMSMIFAVFTPDTSHRKVEAALNKEIALIKKEGISEKELEKVKNVALTGRTFDMFSAEHICQKLGYAETVDGNFKSWVEKMKTLEELNCDQLLHTAKKYWNDQQRHTLFLKPKKVNPLLFFVGIIRRFLPKRR